MTASLYRVRSHHVSYAKQPATHKRWWVQQAPDVHTRLMHSEFCPGSGLIDLSGVITLQVIKCPPGTKLAVNFVTLIRLEWSGIRLLHLMPKI